MTLGIRQTAVSAAVFAAVLIGIISIDARVRDHFAQLVSGGDGVSSWGHRAGEVGSALVAAVRHQSIENAPMVVFAAVGAVLVVFMLKA